MRLSPVTTLVWLIGAKEAQVAGHNFIEPGHIFIGLCKVNDIPLEEAIQEAQEIQRLKAETEIRAIEEDFAS